jgi:dolichol-phosphate mannosyltransferase
MALVSLVIPIRPGFRDSVARIEAIQAELERAGNPVELVFAGQDQGARTDSARLRSAMWVEASLPGLAPAAMAGLDETSGEYLVVLDLDRAYSAGDVMRIVDALATGRSSLAVATRYGLDRVGWRRNLGRILRKVVGTSDPFSGLIGLTRAAFLDAVPRFSAVGSKFSLELFAKIGGRWRDVPVQLEGPRHLPTLGWNDVRHLKRLADHRFGNVSRLVQFCVVGASGMIVDLASYAFFQAVLGKTSLGEHSAPLVGPLNLAMAGFLAVSVALVWNFTLNRRLTFNDAREGSAFRQFLTYLLSNAVSVPLSLLLRLQLPQRVGFFSDHKLAAAVVGIVAGTAVSFSMARWLVFRRNELDEHDGGGIAIPDPPTRSADAAADLALPPLPAAIEPPSRPSWYSV